MQDIETLTVEYSSVRCALSRAAVNIISTLAVMFNVVHLQQASCKKTTIISAYGRRSNVNNELLAHSSTLCAANNNDNVVLLQWCSFDMFVG